MSNARNLSRLLGTDTEIQTGKIANSAITEAKLHTTLDLSSKTLTMPSGVSAFKRVYTGRNTGANGFGFNTSVITLFSVPNVVVNAGEKIWLAYHISIRATSNCQVHTGIIPHYSGSATGYVGDSNWGVGIHDPYSHAQWNVLSSFLSLSDYNTGGGGPFASTGTFNFDIKARNVNSTGEWGSEGGSNVVVQYTPMMATILVG